MCQNCIHKIPFSQAAGHFSNKQRFGSTPLGLLNLCQHPYLLSLGHLEHSLAGLSEVIRQKADSLPSRSTALPAAPSQNPYASAIPHMRILDCLIEHGRPHHNHPQESDRIPLWR